MIRLGGSDEADRGERGVDPLAAFAHRLVGQADDEELRQAAGDLHLDFDRARLQPQERDRGDMRDHQDPPSVDGVRYGRVELGRSRAQRHIADRKRLRDPDESDERASDPRQAWTDNTARSASAWSGSASC